MSQSDIPVGKIAAAAKRDAPRTDIPEPSLEILAVVGDEKEAQALYIAGLRQELGERAQTAQQRIQYAAKIFKLVGAWLASVFALLLLAGFGSQRWFHLSDTVLVTFLATTTVNVLGIFIIVANWLFPKKANSDEKQKKTDG